MIWYKFEIRHGPGHQSTSTSYEGFDYDPDDIALEATFNRLVRDRDLNNASCTPELLDEMPPHIHDRLARLELGKIIRAMKELRFKFGISANDVKTTVNKLMEEGWFTHE